MTPFLERKNIRYRKSIPVDNRVALAICALGSTSELRTIANLFGVGISTTSLLLHDVCENLVNNFFHELIQFPTRDTAIQETIDDFLINTGYPICLGAVDGSHINIKPPCGAEYDYFNYKKHHSVILLAVVNASLQFTYVNVGAPGQSNDSSVFNRSTLSSVIQHEIYSNKYMVVNGTKIQAHLVADSAFCLSQTLMKPYPESPNMPKQQSFFNYRLSRCRCSVERVFGSLKKRFRCLHNDDIDINWQMPAPTHKKPRSNTQTSSVVGVRNLLTHYFQQNPL